MLTRRYEHLPPEQRERAAVLLAWSRHLGDGGGLQFREFERRCDVRACRTCGIALDGRIKRPRTILVNFDGNVSAGGVYCVEHYDKVRDRILGVLAEFDDTAQRHAAGVALRGGGA